MDKSVDNMAATFMAREMEKAVNNIRKTFFDIIEDVKASDTDNLEHLKQLLQDDDLAKQFQIFQENRNKAIRKKILDSTGDLSRQLKETMENYKIGFEPNTEFKGIVK